MNFDFEVEWVKCCGHVYPVRLEESDIILEPLYDEVGAVKLQAESYWKQLKGKRGRLVFVETKEKE